MVTKCEDTSDKELGVVLGASDKVMVVMAIWPAPKVILAELVETDPPRAPMRADSLDS